MQPQPDSMGGDWGTYPVLTSTHPCIPSALMGAWAAEASLLGTQCWVCRAGRITWSSARNTQKPDLHLVWKYLKPLSDPPSQLPGYKLQGYCSPAWTQPVSLTHRVLMVVPVFLGALGLLQAFCLLTSFGLERGPDQGAPHSGLLRPDCLWHVLSHLPWAVMSPWRLDSSPAEGKDGILESVASMAPITAQTHGQWLASHLAWHFPLGPVCQWGSRDNSSRPQWKLLGVSPSITALAQGMLIITVRRVIRPLLDAHHHHIITIVLALMVPLGYRNRTLWMCRLNKVMWPGERKLSSNLPRH